MRWRVAATSGASMRHERAQDMLENNTMEGRGHRYYKQPGSTPSTPPSQMKHGMPQFGVLRCPAPHSSTPPGGRWHTGWRVAAGRASRRRSEWPGSSRKQARGH